MSTNNTETKNNNKRNAARTPKVPIPVSTILVHIRPHLDEVVAVALLRLYGEALFPGISKAPVRYVEGTIAGTDEVWDKDQILPVGIGKGRFDEHRDGQKADRLKNECSATLVAKYLGVENNRELTKLLAETLAGDHDASNTQTQLAELMKVSYRMLKTESRVVFRTVSIGVEAIINQQKYCYGPMEGERKLNDLWKTTWAEDLELVSHPKVVSRVSQTIGNSMRNEAGLVTEFSSVISALWRFPYDVDSVVMEHFAFYIAGLKADAMAFQAALDELESMPVIDVRAQAHPGARQQILQLCVCRTEELLMHKAARSDGNDIILVRSSTGNFQIYTNKRSIAGRGFNIVNLVRMIRWLELPVEKKKAANWEELGMAGDHPDVPNIHYHKIAEAVYCGTLTHPAKPSLISTEALIGAIKYAFDPFYVKKWCNDRGIIMYPKAFKKAEKAREQPKPKNAEPKPLVSLNISSEIAVVA